MQNTDMMTRIDANIALIDDIIKELQIALHGKIDSLAKTITLLKNFYQEKLTGNERMRALLSMTKFDHLLFVIKLNSQLIKYDESIKFSDHTACDLGKFIYSSEFIESISDGKENKTYQELL